ncbi:hypothetical protein HY990_07120 [Candidatus Micrarchaeota archaeon]|nr:hypothetical protein [Candidatus Micrarchaeota archaeon]
MLIFQYRTPAPSRREEPVYQPPTVADLRRFRAEVAQVFLDYRDELIRTHAFPTPTQAQTEVTRRLERLSYGVDYHTHTLRMPSGQVIDSSVFMGLLDRFRFPDTANRVNETFAQDHTSPTHADKIYAAIWQQMNDFLVPHEAAALARAHPTRTPRHR